MTEITFNPFTGNFDFIRDRGPSFVAGEALALGELLTLNVSGEVLKSSAMFSLNLWRLEGVAISTVSLGSLVVVATAGDLVPILFGTAPAAASNGSLVFLSSISGEATLTPPGGGNTVVYSVGTLQGADGITRTPDVLFQPQYISRRP